MNTQRNILQNLTTLSEFERMTPRKIYYINRTTTYDTMTELIELVTQAKQFLMQTKYDYHKYPALIQILFAYKMKLFIILVDTEYLPWNDWYLHTKIQSFFAIIFAPSNDIHSWNDIKTDLKLFLVYDLFQLHQIENIHVVNIHMRFQEWIQKNFVTIQQNNVSLNDWTLEMAIAFTFQQHFDTSLSLSQDWDIGLFLQFDADRVEELIHRDSFICNVEEGRCYRAIHSEYAIHECMAINKIAALLQNNWTRKHGENRLKKYYNMSQNA